MEKQYAAGKMSAEAAHTIMGELGLTDTPLTKAEAHEIIDTLQAGTYDAAKWKVPF